MRPIFIIFHFVFGGGYRCGLLESGEASMDCWGGVLETAIKPGEFMHLRILIGFLHSVVCFLHLDSCEGGRCGLAAQVRGCRGVGSELEA